jgi:DNA polymerase-3 subunit epsilon
VAWKTGRSRTSGADGRGNGTPAFLAIDFETADALPDSACAVGLVRVEGLRIVRREIRLIRPPRPEVHSTFIHGITWGDVEGQPTFAEHWPELADMADGVEFLAAHNAPFDRSVLRACCAAARLEAPGQPFICTVQLARRVWDIRPTKLPNVAERLGLELDHHNALSDAEACAGIVIAALRDKPAAVREMLAEARTPESTRSPSA